MASYFDEVLPSSFNVAHAELFHVPGTDRVTLHVASERVDLRRKNQSEGESQLGIAYLDLAALEELRRAVEDAIDDLVILKERNEEGL